MPRHTATLLALICAGLVLPAGEVAAASDDRYVSLELNHASPDDLRRVDGDGLGASFIYGLSLDTRLFLEARVTGLILERGESGGAVFHQQELGVDAHDRFGRRGARQPFVAGGLSVLRHSVDIEDEDDVGAGVNVGGGILSPPLGRLGLRFRAEARYVHDNYLDGM